MFPHGPTGSTKGGPIVIDQASGEIVFIGELLLGIDFGGGVLTGNHDVFAAKLTSEGEHVWSELVRNGRVRSVPHAAGNGRRR
jgi:hypothetical protein